MPRTRGTKDLEREIRSKLPHSETSPADGDTAEHGDAEAVALALYARALRENDQAEVDRQAGRLLFGPNTVALHRTAIAEHAELSAEAATLEAAEAEIKRLERILHRFQFITPITIEQSEEIGRQLAEADKALGPAKARASEARVAGFKRDALTAWAGPLFGQPESKGGVTMYAGMKVVEAIESLGIHSASPQAWRGKNPQRESKPIRRLINVAPVNKGFTRNV